MSKNRKFWLVLGSICTGLILLPVFSDLPFGGVAQSEDGKTASPHAERDRVTPSGTTPQTTPRNFASGSGADSWNLLTASGSPANAAQDSANSAPPVLSGTFDEIPPGIFKNQLAKLSAPKRERVLEELESLAIPVNNINSLRLSPDGDLYMFCPRPNITDPMIYSVSDLGAEAASRATIPISQLPAINTNPGAEYTIYINFVGAEIRNSAWNDRSGAEPVYYARPFSLDTDETTFTAVEQEFINQVVRKVNDLYSIFQVNVTTVRPAAFDNKTLHALVTPPVDAKGKDNPESRVAGGVAFVNIVARDAAQAARLSPAWIYMERGTDHGWITTVVAHEIGHNFGLGHDGTSNAEYYVGHRVGQFDWWAPIMGYGTNSIAHWSKGEYTNSNNTQDDIAIISRYTGMATSNDDPNIGDLTTSLVELTDVITPNKETSEVLFTARTAGLNLQVRQRPYLPILNNINQRSLYFNVTLANLSNGTTTTYTIPDTARVADRGSINTQIAVRNGDSYRLTVERAGAGNPMATNPTGFTKYGSMGEVLIALRGGGPPSQPPPDSPRPTVPLQGPEPLDPLAERIAYLEIELREARRIPNLAQRTQRITSLNNQLNNLRASMLGPDAARLQMLQRQLVQARRITDPRRRIARVRHLQAQITELRSQN